MSIQKKSIILYNFVIQYNTYLLMNSSVDLGALLQIHMNSLVNLLFPFPFREI